MAARSKSLERLHHSRCHGHPLFSVVLIHVNIVCIPVPFHNSHATLQLLHNFLSQSFSMKLIQVMLQLTCTTSSLVLATSVAPSPVTVAVNFSMDASTCFLRKHACKYFFCFSWSGHFKFGFGLGVHLLDWLMVMCHCLNFFFRPSNSTVGLASSSAHCGLSPCTLTGDSQHYKLGGGALYHPSSGWICHAPRQDPSHSDDNLTQYMLHGALQHMASLLSHITIHLKSSDLPPSI